MTSSSELPVPDAALDAFARAVNEQFAPNDEDRAWVCAIAGPVVAAVLADSVAFVERVIRDEVDCDFEDKYTGVEALQVCSGHLLGLLKLYAGGEVATGALRAAEEERQS